MLTKNIRLSLVVLPLAFTATACVHGSLESKHEGSELGSDKLDQVVIGKTTEADLVTLFGQPVNKYIERLSDELIAQNSSLRGCGNVGEFMTWIMYYSSTAHISGASSEVWKFAMTRDGVVCAKVGETNG